MELPDRDDRISTKTPEGKALKSWSITRLKIKCPYRLKLAYIDRVRPPSNLQLAKRIEATLSPELATSPWEQAAKTRAARAELAAPQQAQPAKQPAIEAPNDRGTRIHKAAEEYINGLREHRIPELDRFAQEFAVLRQAFPRGSVHVERQIGFDRNWKPMAARDPAAWLRVGPDVYAISADRISAALIDLKTGRKDGNEMDHMDQVTLGACAIFEKYPLLSKVVAEVWYLDNGCILKRTFTREQAARFEQIYDRRGTEFTAIRYEWSPEPNRANCTYCPFKTGKLGGPRAGDDAKCGQGYCDANGDEY